MTTLTAVDQLGGREVEQPGLVSQTLALMVDTGIFVGLTGSDHLPREVPRRQRS